MRALPFALGLLVCLSLAGCSGLVPSPDADPARPSVTATPAPVPSDEYPAVLPGAGTDDAAETDRLLAANREGLANRSVRIRQVFRVERAVSGDPVLVQRSTRRIEDETAAFLTGRFSRFDEDGETFDETSTWLRSDVAYQRVDSSSREPGVYRIEVPDDGFAWTTPRYEGRLRYLTSIDLRPVDRRRTDDGLRYVLQATPDRLPPGAADRVEGVRNATLRATFDGDGVLRSLRVTWRNDGRERSVRATYAVRFDRFGTATVPEPEWVERVENRTGNATTATTDTPD